MDGAFREAWNTAIDWLLPPRCAGCSAIGSHWCTDCNASIRLLPEPICKRCGLPKPAAASCTACETNDYAFTAARSCAVYADALRRAILHLKHKRNEAVGMAFSEHLAAVFESANWLVDMLVSIPLAPHRLQKRGFNQSELMASPLSLRLGVPYVNNALFRVRDTRPQFELPRSERWVNVNGVFSVDEAAVRGRSIVLIDDIMTTGATLSAAAKALLEQGAVTVYGLTMARALFESPGDFG